jgi:hypothetical protein
MKEQYEVARRVVSQRGIRVAAHKVGDEFLVEDETPGSQRKIRIHVGATSPGPDNLVEMVNPPAG